jgi:hypothetical protein
MGLEIFGEVTEVIACGLRNGYRKRVHRLIKKSSEGVGCEIGAAFE